MKLRSICPECVLDGAAADYRAASRVEQYRVGGKAIYFAAFPGVRYLPFSAVRRAWIQPSSLSLTGCCGKELPVHVLRMEYQGGFYQNIPFEKLESAEDVLQRILERRPELLQKP